MKDPKKVSCKDCQFLNIKKDIDGWDIYSCSERPYIATAKAFPYKAIFCRQFVEKRSIKLY